MNSRMLILTVVLLVGSMSLSAHNPVNPKSNTTKLQVIDAGSGEPLTGARITIQGSTLSVLTDSEGFFEILLSANQDEVLTISLVSFQSVSIPAHQLSETNSIQLIEK